MSLNRVVLIGNLARDPEMKYTPQGVAVAQSAIAVNRITKNDSGDYDVDFFNITFWRRQAEYAAQYLTKGSKVAIEGRLQSRSWTDQASQQKRTVYEVVVDNVQGLDRRGEGAENAPMSSQSPSNYDEPSGGSAPAPPPAREARASAPAPARQPARPAPASAAYSSDDSDEADPFADE